MLFFVCLGHLGGLCLYSLEGSCSPLPKLETERVAKDLLLEYCELRGFAKVGHWDDWLPGWCSKVSLEPLEDSSFSFRFQPPNLLRALCAGIPSMLRLGFTT